MGFERVYIMFQIIAENIDCAYGLCIFPNKIFKFSSEKKNAIYRIMRDSTELHRQSHLSAFYKRNAECKYQLSCVSAFAFTVILLYCCGWISSAWMWQRQIRLLRFLSVTLIVFDYIVQATLRFISCWIIHHSFNLRVLIFN